MQGFSAKNYAEFWWKKLCRVFGPKVMQGFVAKSFCFGAKSYTRFWSKKLCRVLMQKTVQGFAVKIYTWIFGVKSCAGF